MLVSMILLCKQDRVKKPQNTKTQKNEYNTRRQNPHKQLKNQPKTTSLLDALFKALTGYNDRCGGFWHITNMPKYDIIL